MKRTAPLHPFPQHTPCRLQPPRVSGEVSLQGFGGRWAPMGDSIPDTVMPGEQWEDISLSEREREGDWGEAKTRSIQYAADAQNPLSFCGQRRRGWLLLSYSTQPVRWGRYHDLIILNSLFGFVFKHSGHHCMATCYHVSMWMYVYVCPHSH